ncbi:MAG: TonB-dependent receptor [Bryobacteraceae bacterium]
MRADRLLLAVLLVAGGVTAQTTGQIEGIVRDPAGMPAPGTALLISETRTGAQRRLQTDERGSYLAPGLAPGRYEIEASHTGFRKEIRRGVELVAGRAVRVDFLLELGEMRDSVVVPGEAPLISTAPSDWGGFIEQKKLESLPLNGRDLFDLSSQQPGATVTTNASKTFTEGGGIHVSVNGARPVQNSFRMDGIYINDATGSAPSSAVGKLLGLESIQELQLVSSPFDAEFGRGGGAPFIAVSKSGSNEWHGSAYEFLRNSALDAKNFFDPAGERIPPLRKNQFGGLLSGPLRRNSLFFMANYEGIRLTSGQTLAAVTPTAEARQGNLPGRTVSVAPQVVPYLNLYPLPNGRDYGDGTGQFVSEGITSSREDYVTGKLDAVFSSRLRSAVRYTFDDAVTSSPDPLHVFLGLNDSHYHFLHTETQFIQSPSSIHAFRAGFSRVWNRQDDSQSASIPASMSFIPGQPMGYIAMTSGLTALGILTANSIALMPQRFVPNDFQFNYAVVHIHGAHALRFGGAFDRVRFNEQSERDAKGVYTFSSLVDFLQARPASADAMMPGSDTIRGWRQSIFSVFVQEEFRASSRLSLTLGLRYEPYSTPTEANGKIATLRDFLHDPAFTVGGPLFPNPSRTNFAPRASMAILPFGSGKTVIRAGAGIFYDLLSIQELFIGGVRVPPFFNIISANKPAFPNLFQALQSAPPTSLLDMLDYNLQQPYVAQYQFMVQQELARNTVLKFGYVGSRAVHLPGTLTDVNPYRPETLSDGSLFFPADDTRLNPAFGRMKMRRTQFDASYHSFQAGFERKLRGGFGFQFKYVWGKSLDDSSNGVNRDFVNSDGVPTMFNYGLNRGRSDFDLRHTFGGNFSWVLPQVRGAVAGRVLGGWEIYGLVQAQTGPPFNPTIGFDRARLTGGGTSDPGERPMYVAAPGANLIRGDPLQWFDPNAFALPPAGMYGNLGRNTLQGPGLVTSDLALHKVLWSTERQSVRLRVEAFNVVNHPNFQIPSALTLFTSALSRVGSAGQITSTTTTSRQIQLALRWMF